KILKRVIGEIRKKEEANWPASSQHHDDAQRYVEALSKAQEDIWNRLPKFERGADQRQKLLIEFVLSQDAAFIALAEYEMRESGDAVRVTSRRPIALLQPSRAYVENNMRLIAADSFKLDGDKLDEMLRPLALLHRR
ncbi:MAG: hypothetical protein HY270_17690, partial [Deltaproteobacteria bacterium]|nr:hypothetical protein [Deltaproteobacteria bacterium]